MKNSFLFRFAAMILFALQMLLVQRGLNWFIFFPFFHIFGLMILLKIIFMNGKELEAES